MKNGVNWTEIQKSLMLSCGHRKEDSSEKNMLQLFSSTGLNFQLSNKIQHIIPEYQMFYHLGLVLSTILNCSLMRHIKNGNLSRRLSLFYMYSCNKKYYYFVQLSNTMFFPNKIRLLFLDILHPYCS